VEKIEWTHEIATGIPEIDREHREFIHACAGIVNCADRCLESKKVIMSMRKLESIAEAHFSTEGRMMAQSMYTDKKGHYRLHGHFLEELKALKSRAEAGETGHEFAAEIKERLADWFILHIKKTDMKMAQFLKLKK